MDERIWKMPIPGGHVAGLPMEEMAPALLTGGSVLAAGLYRAARARIVRARARRRRPRLGAARGSAPR